MKRLLGSFLFALGLLSASPQPLVVDTAGDTATTTGTMSGTYSGDLRYCLNYINLNPADYNISFTLTSGNEDIQLAGMLPIINLTGSNAIVIDGSNSGGSGTQITIDGVSQAFPGFFARQGTVTIQNIEIYNTAALGGLSGGELSGGGLGAGGALFIDEADVFLSNVTMTSNLAQGGNSGGPEVSSGGGGMFGGNGGLGTGSGGGGGGIGGSGGNGTSSGSGGGGGLGLGGSSTIGNGGTAGGSGFDGSGSTIAGSAGDGAGLSNAGGSGGGGGSGSPSTTFSGGATPDFGGGGGGGMGTEGGDGGYGGGGGGSGSSYAAGGNGGFGGGGGSFNGGDGQSDPFSNAGFGGGAGAGGGNGGFGGGAGHSNSNHGGIGAGGGQTTRGGGGAAMGGAIFLNSGGTLTVTGPLTISNGTVTGGSSARSGGAFSNAIFSNTGGVISTSPLSFMPALGDTVTISVTSGGAIGDDGINTIPSGQSWTQGTADGAQGLTMAGAGTLDLSGSGTNTYSGTTSLNDGIVRVASDANLGQTGVQLSFSGGTLQFSTGATYSRPATLDINGGSFDTDGSNVIWGGAISSTAAGTLTKLGSGNFILVGDATYTGITVVSAGGFLGGATNAFSGSSSVHLDNVAGAVLDLNFFDQEIPSLSGGGGTGGNVILRTNVLTVGSDGTSTTFAGVISSASGSSGLTKVGIGTLTLSGANTFIGPTLVTEGVLSLLSTGSLAGAATVSSGATLKGAGSIAGAVVIESGGTIQPGNSVGTLSTGPFTLNSGSITAIEVSVPASSEIIVTGTALLAGTLQLTFDAGSYSPTTYTLLTATDTITTEFTTVTATGLPSSVGYTLIYDPESVILSIFMAIPPLPPHAGKNAKAVYKYLIEIQNYDSISTILAELSALTPSQVLAALESISPARNAIASFTAANIAFQAMDVLCHRIDTDHYRHSQKRLTSSQKEAALLVANESLPYGSAEQKVRGENRSLFWLNGFGEWDTFHAQDENPAFGALWGGALLGYDFFGEGGMFGGAAGYTRAGIQEHGNAGKETSDIYMASVYGNAYIGNAYIDLCFFGALNQFYTTRNIFWSGFFEKAQGKHTGWQALPHLGLGYDLKCDSGILEPFATLDWALLFEDTYFETGSDFLSMKVKERTSSILRSSLGLRLYQEWSGEWGSCLLRETLAYINKQPFNVGKMTAAVVGAPASFSVTSFTHNQSLVTPGIEILYFSSTKNAMASFSYDGEFGSGYTSNEFQAKFGKYF